MIHVQHFYDCIFSSCACIWDQIGDLIIGSLDKKAEFHLNAQRIRYLLEIDVSWPRLLPVYPGSNPFYKGI